MPWAKLDDNFADHPKVVEAGPLAGWLYVTGLCYAARHLTDGFIPQGQVRKLADVDNASGLAGKLVEVGLWERVEVGYQIHDYCEYNPSAEKVKQERAASAKRQAEWRERQRDEGGKFASNGDSNGVTNASHNTTPCPYPYPSPYQSPSPYPSNSLAPSASAVGARERDERSPDDRSMTKDDRKEHEALYEALVEGWLYEPATKSEAGKVHKAAKEIRKAGGTPDEVEEAYAAFKTKWPGVDATPNAIAGHWGELLGYADEFPYSLAEQDRELATR